MPADPKPESMNRTLRVVRLLLILLEERCVRVSPVARRLGVLPRYITLDLNLLSTILPLKQVFEGRNRVWCLDPAVGVEHLGIVDRISLVLGQEVASFLKGTALHEGLSRVDPEGLAGVEGRLARNLALKFRHHGEPARSYFEHREVMDDLLDALIRDRQVCLSYDRDGQVRDMGPLQILTLVLYRRAVYLLCRRVNGDRTDPVLRLALDRVRGVRPGEPVPYPVDWNPDAHLAPWFGVMATGTVGPVVLDFSPKVRRFVLARRWHASQEIVENADGSVRLRMHTGGRELVRWVLEWGETCTVREPAWLRDEVIRELRGALARYETAP